MSNTNKKQLNSNNKPEELDINKHEVVLMVKMKDGSVYKYFKFTKDLPQFRELSEKRFFEQARMDLLDMFMEQYINKASKHPEHQLDFIRFEEDIYNVDQISKAYTVVMLKDEYM